MQLNNLNQKITYWAQGALDSYAVRTYNAPQIVSARYQESQKLFIDGAGEQRVSKAVVYTIFEPAVGDYFFNGNDLVNNSPRDNREANRVLSVDSMVDLRGKTRGYKAWL